MFARPMNHPRIYLSRPHMSGEELELVLVKDVFATNWVAPLGPHVDAFEKELASYVGVDHCAALSSGTAAIHLALIILGVKAGDEVLCSSFTFSASCNPIIYTGATPVFVDSESLTWNMDPALLREAVLDRKKKTGRVPKACILVHLYGMPAQIAEIQSVCSEFGIALIEDAAEALGSEYKGRKLGSFGDLGILSFNGNKIITTSGGGALLSNNASWIEKARFLATQARDPAPHYQHSELGYNYRLSNVCAAIGRGQLRVIDSRVSQRRSNYDFYLKTFENRPEIAFLAEPPGFFTNRWLTTGLFGPPRSDSGSRERVRVALANQNIESRPLWKPMHLQPFFASHPFVGSHLSADLFARGLCLPSGSDLTKDQLHEIVEVVQRAT
jgi:dTDP-4-amino-4,6-dideoxygalactose transaminase